MPDLRLAPGRRSLALGALLLATAPAPAQFLKIEKAPDFNTDTRINAMRDGKQSAKDPDNKAAIDVVTRMLAYRLTDPQALLGRIGKNDLGMPIHPIHDQLRDVIRYALPMKAFGTLTTFQTEYANEFGKQLEARLKEVLGHREPIVRIAAARMLAYLGRTGYEEVADSYVALLRSTKEKEGDEIKYFALQGLRDLLAIPNPPDQARSVINDVRREREVAKALVEFVNRPYLLPADAPPDEIEAQRYIRREAVRALGQFHQPVLRSGGVVDSEPAYALLKVACRDATLNPEPNTSEQIEALVGLCQMACNPKDVNQDYAAAYAGWALRDLGFQRQQDGSSDDKSVVPWKASGARLGRTLGGWRSLAAELPKAKAGDRVVAMADRAITDILKHLENGERASIDLTALDGWVSATPPSSASLVPDDPKAVITLRDGRAKKATLSTDPTKKTP